MKEEEFYQKIVSLGKELAPFQESWKLQENLVEGCQSVMYLHSACEEGRMVFYAFSEALISAGLAALLINFYNGKSPSWILQNAPDFLEKLNLSLTPSRINGLHSLLALIKKRAFFAQVQLIKLKEHTLSPKQ